MRILYLDVASHDGLIACVSPDVVVASQSIDHRITDHELMPAIETVLKNAKWKHEDITHIACISGPGGFTSLRVGVSAANALRWALKIPSCGIHMSDVYAARAAGVPEPPLRDVIWIHSTKKHELFLRGFGSYANLAPEASLMKLEDAVAVIPLDTPLIGELIPEHQMAFKKRGLHLAELRPTIEILPEFLKAQSYSEQTILPWYGRGI